jgi:hypothetical protein
MNIKQVINHTGERFTIFIRGDTLYIENPITDLYDTLYIENPTNLYEVELNDVIVLD